MEELTQQEIQSIINAAFDSVTVINNSESSADDISRNVEHLKIMMSKDWFVAGLTTEQSLILTDLIK
jgi:hypothetical protein